VSAVIVSCIKLFSSEVVEFDEWIGLVRPVDVQGKVSGRGAVFVNVLRDFLCDVVRPDLLELKKEEGVGVEKDGKEEKGRE